MLPALCTSVNLKNFNTCTWIVCLGFKWAYNAIIKEVIFSHLLYAEAQYDIHVGWEQSEERVEGPVVGEVSHNDGPQWL